VGLAVQDGWVRKRRRWL